MMTAQATTQNNTAAPTAAQVLDAVQPTAQNPAAPASTASAAAAAPDAAPKADDKVSPKLQMLIQREKAAVERERTAKTREEQLIAREATLAAREAKLEEFENIRTKNPRKALELLGMTYQDLTQVELNDGELPADMQIKKVEEKFDTFLKAQEDEKRLKAEEAQKLEAQKYEQTIETHKKEIGDYIKENSARYELIAFEQSEELVYDVIAEHFERTKAKLMKDAEDAGEDAGEIVGEIMTIAQAADKVEAYLEKKYDQAKSLSKVQALLARKAKENLPKLQTPTRQMPTTTLTNNLSAAPTQPRKSPISDEERIAKAIAYAKNLRPSL